MAKQLRDEDPEEVLRRILKGMNGFATGIAFLLFIMVALDVVNVAFGLHMKIRRSSLPTTWEGSLPSVYAMLTWGGLVSILNFVPPIRRFCWRYPLAAIFMALMLGALALVLIIAFSSQG